MIITLIKNKVIKITMMYRKVLDYCGRGSNSKYDIFIDKKSGELLLFRKGGLGDSVRTGYFIK